MKKIKFLVAVISLFLLTGCKSQDIKEAEKAYEEENYSKVVDLIGKYELEDEEMKNILLISNGCIAFENKDYEQTINNLKGRTLSESQREVLNNAYIKKYKEEIDNTEDMSIAINAYCKELDDTTALDEYVANIFRELYSSNDFKDYAVADAMIENIEDRCAVKSELEEIKNKSGINRAEAFLIGKWVRKDGTALDGMIINVNVNNGSISAIVQGVDENEYDFAINDLKWQNGSFVDDVTFTVNSLTKGEYGSSYSASTGIISYSDMQIYMHSVENGNDYNSGNNQVWIKEEFTNKFSDVEPLSKEDYVVNASCSDELKEKYKNNILESLKADYGTQGYYYWYYNEEEDESRESVITTNRDIQIGSAKEKVIEAYGIGATNLFDKKTDELYDAVDDSLKKMMDEECDEFIKYTIKDVGYIEFYFNEQDEVVMISYYLE